MKSGIPFPQNKGYSTEVGKENWFLTKAKGNSSSSSSSLVQLVLPKT